MLKCHCGSEHCCHEMQKTEIKEGKNEYGYEFSFRRTTCADCQEFLGDKLLEK